MNFYVPYRSGSIISNYNIILNRSNNYQSADHSFVNLATEFLSQKQLKSNVVIFYSSVP